MAKKISIVVIGSAIAVIIALAVSLSLPNEKTDTSNKERPFHVTLASPDIYGDNGTYQKSFEVSQGKHILRFVPNGDSPKKLSITISGESVSFEQTFDLEGTSHETGLAQYYTWDYIGNKQVDIPQTQQVQIIINPHGNLLGPVSVSLLKQN